MGLFRDLQSEIEKRSLPDGGWPSGDGHTAGIETTCYALMALGDHQGPARQRAIDLLLRTQNPDGSWPAFDGDDPEGCWATSLAVIALHFVQSQSSRIEKALRWLLDNEGHEGHWFWKWKFRMVDRAVQFNPDEYGWPWFPGTVSWVVPTAFSLIALKQSFRCCRNENVLTRIRLGTEMLLDRACQGGGWNAGNVIVFGTPLNAHIDTTAIALLALREHADPVFQGLNWLRQACVECSSPYSLAWSVLAFSGHREDQAVADCIARLHTTLALNRIVNLETLSLSVIATSAGYGASNPFQLI
jgi:hypothetical protein